MKVNSLRFFLILLFLPAFFLGACSPKTDQTVVEQRGGEEDGVPQKGGEATFAYEADAGNFDPIKASSGINFPLLRPVYDTLVEFTPELEPVPGLAESWEFQGEKTLVLTLRKGVTFQDGTPFNAESVKFNIERVNSTDSTVTELANVKSVEVVDETTVKLHLSQPDSSLLLALSYTGGMMVSPSAVKKYGEDFSQNPVGTGPFKVVNHIPNGEIVYEANESYWKNGQPFLDKMTIKIMPDETTRINALRSGEVDFAENISPGNVVSLEKDEKINFEKITSVPFKVIYLNAQKPPLNNKAVRQAINHSIDREALVHAINFGSGEPAYQPFPKGYWAHDETVKIDYDPKKAKKILKEAKVEDASFKMIHLSNAYDSRLAEAVKGQLQEVGIEVELQPMEYQAAISTFFAERKETSYLNRWSGRPDPQLTAEGVFSIESYFSSGHSTDEIENLLYKAGTTFDQEERKKLYAELNRQAVLEEAIVIPLFFTPRTAIMNHSLKGYEPNMLERPMFSTVWKSQ
ncbi:ABC transporter substrate-binding protein [Niallia sp. XMNu-256]|uniref:ABC transporter substrate-binding protein n=1 Tax=Niallia sp. XMNu-256 TaxID=3082444 RepID=UPI0030CDB618